MENDLDRIAGGEQDRVEWLKGFYFGNDDQRGLRTVVDNLGEIDAREINSVYIADDITLRIGKFGPYLEVPSDDPEKPRRVNIPEALAPDELTANKARELIDAPIAVDRVIGINPESGKLVVAKDGRFGPYVTEADPIPEVTEEERVAAEAAAAAVALAAAETAAALAAAAEVVDPLTGEIIAAKPKRKPAVKKPVVVKQRTASIFKTMDLATLDLDTALRLLDLPRVVGLDPETEAEITAQNGRFGPYLKKGTDTRSLPSEELIFDIDLAGAIELYAQPKYGGRAASSALKEFDADPESGKPIKIKDGRFGAYVTDGTTNATIPRGETIEEIDFERAVQLLADKRAKGPAKPRAKAPAKKAAVKKPAVKKPAVAKPAAKKPAVRKPAVAKAASATTTVRKPAVRKPVAAKTGVAKTAAPPAAAPAASPAANPES
jgi:DNA topoisomerase-1